MNKIVTAPEVILLEKLKSITSFISSDLKNNKNNEQNSYLYKLLQHLKLERYGYFDEIKTIFLASGKDTRRMNIDIVYNMQVTKYPSIYLNLGSESYGENGMGMDEGYRSILDENETYKTIQTRRFNANYSLTIFTDNSNEALVLYHLYKTLLIGFTQSLSMEGIENLKISGQDISKYQELNSPGNIFLKLIGITFQYETSVLSPFDFPFLTDFDINGTPTEEITTITP